MYISQDRLGDKMSMPPRSCTFVRLGVHFGENEVCKASRLGFKLQLRKYTVGEKTKHTSLVEEKNAYKNKYFENKNIYRISK